METCEEFEDLIVLVDLNETKIKEECEVLEDLITIEDEGIMDISHKLQQRDFDEYINSSVKDITLLPKSFSRIRQNVQLLNSCQPLTIQVVDCKKFKIFYNDKLSLDLKTRDKLNGKFKDILFDKEDNISDAETIEIDSADDSEMEDLIMIDYEQKEHAKDEIGLTQKINLDVEDANKTESCDEVTSTANVLEYKENDLATSNGDNINTFHCKSGNIKTSDIFKFCNNISCLSFRTQHSTCTPNTIYVQHYHPRKDDEKELERKKLVDFSTSNDNSFCKKSQPKKHDLLNEDHVFNSYNNQFPNTPKNGQQILSSNYNEHLIIDKNKINKVHNISKTNNEIINKDCLIYKPKNSPKKLVKKYNKLNKTIQLNIGMQKKIEEMLVTVRELKNKSSKKSINSNFLDCSKMVNDLNMCPTQVNLALRQQNDWQGVNPINIYQTCNMEVNNFLSRNLESEIKTSPCIPKPYFNDIDIASKLLTPVRLSPETNYNLHCTNQNNNFSKFIDKNIDGGFMTKSHNISSINFMKSHLRKLAKANETCKNIKIRPICNYGVSKNIQEQEMPKTPSLKEPLEDKINSNTTIINSSSQEGVRSNLSRVRKITDNSNMINYNNSSMVARNHKTLVKILQNKTPEINKELDPTKAEDCKGDVVTHFHNQRSQHGIVSIHKDEVPQVMPTLQNCKVVKRIKVPKTDHSLKECPNIEILNENKNKLWRIPTIKKTGGQIYSVPVKSVKMEVDNYQRSSKVDDNIFGQFTQKIVEKPITEERVKRHIIKSEQVEQGKTKPSIKVPEHSQNLKNASRLSYQSPVQCVNVETYQTSPKIFKKPIKDVNREIMRTKIVGHVKPTPSARVPEKDQMESNEKPGSSNSCKEKKTFTTSPKVIRMGYSPPVLPIPTFKRTFEILAKVNLISKYRYRRNHDIFKYAMVDQEKILSNGSITKDLVKYSKTSI